MKSKVTKNHANRFYAYMQKHKRVRYFSLTIGCVVGLLFLINLGRYVKKIIDNHLFKTEEFYFNSDKLTEDIKQFEIGFWDGVIPYDITIQMDSLKNDLKGASVDINYNITCQAGPGVNCELSKTQGLLQGSENGNNRDSFSVRINPTAQFHEGDSAQVTVKAIAEEPYRKEIGATFKLSVKYYRIGYKIIDKANQPYFDLLITNAARTCTVKQAFTVTSGGNTVSYNANDQIGSIAYDDLSAENKAKVQCALVTLNFNPNDLRLDMTNTNYLNRIEQHTRNLSDGYTYVDRLKFQVGAESSTIVRFYKMDVTRDYTYPITNNTSIVTFTAE